VAPWLGGDPRFRLPVRSPRIQFTWIRIDAAAGEVAVPVDGQALGLFPAADGPGVSIQVGGDFLPGLEPGFW